MLLTIVVPSDLSTKPLLCFLIQQEGLAVDSIARDDPSPFPGMHRDHNAPACDPAYTATRNACGRIVGCDRNAR